MRWLRGPIAWLVGFLARWQDRYLVLDTETARMFTVPNAHNATAGACVPPSETQ